MSRKHQQSNIVYKVVSSESNSAIIDGLDENSGYAGHTSANTGAGEGSVRMPVSVSIISKYLTFLHVILHFSSLIVLLHCIYFLINFNINKDTYLRTFWGVSSLYK